MRRTLSIGVVILAVAAVAAADPAVVGSLRVLSGPSPIAGTCPFSVRGALYDAAFDPGSVDREEETEVAVNPTDPQNIIVGWLQDAGRAIVVASTKDGGSTWNTAVVPGLTTCTGGDRERVLHTRLAFGPDGTAYVGASPVDGFFPDPGSFATHIAVSRSTDGGVTWSEAVYLDDIPVLNDFDTFTAEPDVPGAVDVLWSPTEAALEPIVLSRSVDGGLTWTDHVVRGPAPGAISANRIVAHPDGTLLVFIHDAPVQTFLGLPAPQPLTVTRSTDKGATWSEPVTLAPDATAYNWPLATAGPDGTVYVAWRMVTDDGSVDVYLRRSTDAGASWSDPAAAFTYVPKGTNDPAIAVGPHGEVGIVFYDGRNDAPGGIEEIEVWFAHAHDGTGPWDQARIAGPFDLAATPGGYFGLIQGLAVTPCGFLASFVLGPPLAERGQTDVYLARVAVGQPAADC